MQSRFGGCLCLTVGLIVLFELPLSASDPAATIDVSKGNVDGRSSLIFLPVKGVEAQKPLSPDGFVVRLISGTAREHVLEKAAGEWFALPADKYKFWLEGSDLITPYSSVLSHSDRPFQGKGVAALVPVEAAGTVVLDPETAVSSPVILRLLHLDSHNRAPYPQREFSRPVLEDEFATGVLMPEGSVVATLVDRESKNYLALSRPVEVKSAARVAVRPTAPSDRETDLLVRLQREKYLRSHDEFDVDLVVKGDDDKPRGPDVVISPADRIYAIWYGLEDKRVVLEVSSKSVFLPADTIVLRPGKVESYSNVLRPRPDVDVQLHLPPSLLSADLKVELLSDQPGKTIVREVDLPAGTESLTLDKVPPERLDVALHVPPWIFHQAVDVSDGQNAIVYFEPVPITITGTVFRGGRGHPATLEFQTTRRGETLPVRTDARGAYEVALYRAGAYIVSVLLDDVEGPAHVELLEHLIREDSTLDFRIPHTDFSVRVVDEKTREGVPKAIVMVGNRYLSEASLLRGEEKEKASSQRITTDEAGYGSLPPVHPGTLTLLAEAEGYLPSDTYKEEVEDSVWEKEITIDLLAIDDTIPLRVLLPTGAPAGNAEVRIQASLDNGPPLWSGTADQQGLAQIPRNETEILVLVRHPQAGFLVRRTTGFEGQLAWSLPALGEPLSVIAKRPWSEPASWAQFALWVEGQYLAGDTLRWLSGANPGADIDGFWQAPNIPLTPIKILAWSWSSNESINGVELESLATAVPYTRAGPVEVETLN